MQLACAVGPDPAIVRGDPLRLEQVVANLVSNAIKYTNAGGRVEGARDWPRFYLNRVDSVRFGVLHSLVRAPSPQRQLPPSNSVEAGDIL